MDNDFIKKYLSGEPLKENGTPSEEEILRDLQNVLSEEKFTHSLGVSEEACRLAEIYGGDRERCRVAGLLHDCAKWVKPEQLMLIGKCVADFGNGFDYNGVNRRVVHGPLGAFVAEHRYGIRDKIILDAIANHVTGAPEMSLESVIIFLADYTERNREGEFFELIRRKISEEGLYAAVAASCEGTIRLILERGEPIDVRTVYTRNWALTKIQ